MTSQVLDQSDRTPFKIKHMIICCLVGGVAHLRGRSVWSSGVMILCSENWRNFEKNLFQSCFSHHKCHIMLPAVELKLHGEKSELW